MMLSVWTLGTALQAPGYSSEGAIAIEQLRGVFILYAALFVIGVAVQVTLLVRYVREPIAWVRKINRLLWRPWSGSDLLLVVLAVVVLHLVVLGALRTVHLAGWLSVPNEQYLWIVAHSVALHWAAIAVVLLRARERGISWQVGFSHTRWSLGGDVFKGVAAYVAAVPILVFYAALYHIWLQWTGHEPEIQEVVRLFADMEGGFMFFYFIVLATIVAPIAEELLFRGMLMPALGRRAGMGAAIVISSVLFALMHFHIPSLVPLFVFSIALSLAYIYTESIIVPIVMHMLFNMVSLIVMLMIG